MQARAATATEPDVVARVDSLFIAARAGLTYGSQFFWQGRVGQVKVSQTGHCGSTLLLITIVPLQINWLRFHCFDNVGS